MDYCTIENITERIGETALIQLTDDAGTGEADEDLATAAIGAASATIDSYCQGRYSVPLTPIPAQIAGLCVDIAVYNLYSRSDLAMPEVRKDRYNAAIRFLEKVADGKIQLGADTPAQINTDNTVNITSAPRNFTRRKMRGF